MDRNDIERKEFEREVSVRQAVDQADGIIMGAADGDREEIILLTALLCKEFAEKIIFMVKLDAERKQIAAEYKLPPSPHEVKKNEVKKAETDGQE